MISVGGNSHRLTEAPLTVFCARFCGLLSLIAGCLMPVIELVAGVGLLSVIIMKIMSHVF